MSEALVPHSGNGQDVATVDSDLLVQMGRDPNVTAEKFAAFVDYTIKAREYQRQCDREDKAEVARVAFRAAKAAMQAELPVLEKDIAKTQTQSKFVDLGDAIQEWKPVWTRHGFSTSYDVEVVDATHNVLVGYLDHAGGHREVFRSPPFEADTTGPQGKVNKTLLHGEQSAISYVTRGVLFRMMGMTPKREDDDGNAGGGTIRTNGETRTDPPPPPPVSRWLTDAFDVLKAAKTSEAWVASMLRMLLSVPTTADLDALEADTRAYIAQAPAPVQTQVKTAMQAAAERLKPKPATLPKFEAMLLGPDKEPLDGVLHPVPMDYVLAYLAAWNSFDAEEQAMFFDNNAANLTLARALDRDAARASASIVRPEPLFEQPEPEQPKELTHAEWADQRMLEMAAITHLDHASKEAFDKLVSSMIPRMKAIKAADTALYNRIYAAFTAKSKEFPKDAAAQG